MKITSPGQPAFRVSLLISFISAMLVLIFIYLSPESTPFIILGSVVFSFGISFLLVYFILHRFIIKTIPITKEKLPQKMEGRDVIQ